jgi:thiamine-phosphate pyrophosphorylase
MSVMLDRFYPIVHRVAWIERLIACGARCVQLRMKECSDHEIRAAVRASKELCARNAVQLIVNDYWRVAIEERCDFVHLGQGDLDTADVTAIRKAGIRIGISTHDHAELERALALHPDYVALGPIYPTVLKEMPCAPQGLERIREWKRLVGSIPLVAIGGLTVERLPSVFAMGADCAAVVTDIVRNADPDARTREWIDATR